MNYYNLVTALTALSVLFAPTVESRPVPLNDTNAPTATLVMNDGRNAGPIINTALHWEDIPALGCSSYIVDSEMEAWDSIFTATNFSASWIQDRTYFFNSAPSSRSFTLTASDASGIKRIRISVLERDVALSPGTMIVYDDGPTEFFNVSPSRAFSYFQPVWYSSSAVGPTFSHYDKRLELEPRQTRIPRDVVLNFDLTTFGAKGWLHIFVEDNAGNQVAGTVYLAPRSACY